MDNPEKLAWDEEKQNKHTTQYVLDTTIHKQTTNNVNKTWTLLQTTGSQIWRRTSKNTKVNVRSCLS